MSAASTVLAGLFGIPLGEYGVAPVDEFDISPEPGVALRTRLYRPDVAGTFPTLMMRVPYGFLGFGTVAELYAERGYYCILQACRGTGDSSGVFDPLRNERTDGLATLAWLDQQPWYDRRLGLTGPSYLGYAQWAIADALPPTSAIATKVSTANFEPVVFPGGSFALQLWLSWLQVVEGLTEAPMTAGLQIATGDIERQTARVAGNLPLIDSDVELTGHPVPFWREWFDSAIDNPDFWSPLDHRTRMSADTPPNHFVSGWYDFMIDQLMDDYQRLVDLGQRPYLTVGDWHHISPELQAESVRETLPWMEAHLKGNVAALRTKPVRIHISGGTGWRELDSFPPPNMAPAGLYLHEAGRLDSAVPEDGQPTAYIYDPADPTPSIGGAFFAFSGAGRVDNRKLEQRLDVITFTSGALSEDLTVIGQPELTLFARSSSDNTDFFARLTDVHPGGRSENICDAIIRITPEMPRRSDGTWEIKLRLHHCAHTFLRGHAIRLQVSSGAHPRFARNTGTGEPVGTATRLVQQGQSIFHDSMRPSRLILPVWGGA